MTDDKNETPEQPLEDELFDEKLAEESEADFDAEETNAKEEK